MLPARSTDEPFDTGTHEKLSSEPDAKLPCLDDYLGQAPTSPRIDCAMLWWPGSAADTEPVPR